MDQIRALASAAVDWEQLYLTAYRHRVVALVHASLNRANVTDIPPAVQDKFQQYVKASAFISLSQTRELLRIVDLLENSSIPVLPFKGPMLGHLVYENPALRPFGDLDILVPREAVLPTKELLLADGYTPCRPMDERREKAYLRTQMGYEFRSASGRSVVEVHWAFLNRVHGFDLDPEDVWQRSVLVSLAGQTVRNLSDEDLLLYLCAHGSKSFWHRLLWICDIAALIDARPALDWDVFLQRTEALHSRRMIYLGLYLAHALLDAPVPDDVLHFAERDDELQSLAERVYSIHLKEQAQPLQGYDRAHFHLQMRERRRDRLPYYGHLARIFFLPNDKDRLVELPTNLSFLYFLMRPVRMISGRLTNS